MTNLTIGDLAMTFQSRASQHRIKSDMLRLGTELTSGVTSDLRAATGGNLGALANVEHQLGTLAAFRVAASEAATFTGAVQRALETVQETSSTLGPALLQVAATDAKARFATVISVLNTQVADRSILAGAQGSGAALAGAETMIAAIQAAVATETTADGIEAAVVAWFDDPGGGFETGGYLGSTSDIAPFRIGPHEQASIGMTAGDPAFRDLFKGYAMAALVADGALSTDHDERVALLDKAATRILTSDKSMAEQRAAIGTLEARIDTATARNSAETGALELARNDIVAIDPFRTATDLQAVQTQLETLYALTARLSRLSLTEYLR
jgi:flagellar hook-associated protein 3 FlgL